jgi:hypothetical protein
MGYSPCTNHVQININQALNQMGIRLYGRSVISIFPKGSLTVLPLIVFLTCPARDQLHRFWYNPLSLIIPYHQMNMV